MSTTTSATSSILQSGWSAASTAAHFLSELAASHPVKSTILASVSLGSLAAWAVEHKRLAPIRGAEAEKARLQAIEKRIKDERAAWAEDLVHMTSAADTYTTSPHSGPTTLEEMDDADYIREYQPLAGCENEEELLAAYRTNMCTVAHTVAHTSDTHTSEAASDLLDGIQTAALTDYRTIESAYLRKHRYFVSSFGQVDLSMSKPQETRDEAEETGLQSVIQTAKQLMAAGRMLGVADPDKLIERLRNLAVRSNHDVAPLSAADTTAIRDAYGYESTADLRSRLESIKAYPRC